MRLMIGGRATTFRIVTISKKQMILNEKSRIRNFEGLKHISQRSASGAESQMDGWVAQSTITLTSVLADLSYLEDPRMYFLKI